MSLADAPTVVIGRAGLRAEQLASRAARVSWRALFVPLLRRLPLLVLMAIPFLLGYAGRLAARAVLGVVWALGWTAAWLWFTLLEGWTSAAGRSG